MKQQENNYGVVLFDTSHDAILCEKLIRKKLNVSLMPIPRQFSSGCGIVLRFETKDRDRMEALIREHNISGHMEFVEGGEACE